MTHTSRVSEQMVEAAAKRHMQVRSLGMLRAWESCTEETRHSYRVAMRCALEAALSTMGDVVAVSDIRKVIERWDNGQYGPGQVVEALRNLSAILNRGGK